MVRKVGERRFIAGVKIGGEWIFSEDKNNVTAGQARSAVGKLNEKLRAMKARVLLSEEYKMVEPVAPVVTPPVRRQVPAAPVAPKVATTLPKVAETEEGWITPRSDRAAWVESYRHAVQVCTGFRAEGLKGLHGEAAKQFRIDVTAVMRSVGCIGPWSERDGVPWTHIAGVSDPTVAPIKPGTGDRRVLKDINNIKRINGGEQILEDSPFKYLQEEYAAEIAAQMGTPATPKTAPKPAPATTPAGYTYSFGSAEQRKLASDQGRRLIAQAREQGKDADTQRIWGMIGFVLIIRAMGLPPHTEFERKLREAGVTEEYLREKSGKAA
jgi:hypothetical protein